MTTLPNGSIRTAVGRWTPEEHAVFVKGMQMYPRQWKRIAELVQTRTAVQIRTHAQKCWNDKMGRQSASSSSPKAVRARRHPPTVGVGPSTPRKKTRTASPNIASLDLRAIRERIVPFTPRSQQPEFVPSPVLLPHEVMRAVAYSQPDQSLVLGAKTAENNSPTSITDPKLFTRASSGLDLVHGEQPFLEPLKPAAGAATSMDLLMNSIKECPPASDAYSLSTSSDQSSSSDDERFEPIGPEIDTISLLNDDMMTTGILGLLFDEAIPAC